MNSESFKKHCADLGIELLRPDVDHLKVLLKRLPKHRWRIFLMRYAREWCAGMAECDSVIKKQNAGRFRANSWAREFLK